MEHFSETCKRWGKTNLLPKNKAGWSADDLKLPEHDVLWHNKKLPLVFIIGLRFSDECLIMRRACNNEPRLLGTNLDIWKVDFWHEANEGASRQHHFVGICWVQHCLTTVSRGKKQEESCLLRVHDDHR